MEKRYQVFVSSTYQDLQEERQEIMHALLELDCIPSGMELFPAANASQWELIKKVIDDCDYYILVIGGRYGSLGTEGLSYTEMEYRYALSIQKPTIAFLHKDPDQIIAAKTEKSSDGKTKLKAFRELAEKKLCKHWASPAELGSVVSRSLIQLMKTTPAVGWVRADELPDRDATLELLRLRKEVDALQSELEKTRTSAPKGAENLAQGDDLVSLKLKLMAYDPGDIPTHTSWIAYTSQTWNDIFASIAPIMISDASESAIRHSLNIFIARASRKTLGQDDKLKGKTLSEHQIEDEYFQTIKVQLKALGLIKKGEKNRSVKDSETYWTLTPYGDDLMTRLRAIKSISAAKSTKSNPIATST